MGYPRTTVGQYGSDIQRFCCLMELIALRISYIFASLLNSKVFPGKCEYSKAAEMNTFI